MAWVLTGALIHRNINKILCVQNTRILSSCCFSNEKVIQQRVVRNTDLSKRYNVRYDLVRFTSKDATENTQNENQKKRSLFQKFKEMYKNYWYVLVPVHLVTSAFWFGGFYYLAKSGVDIASILESWNVNEKIVKPFRDSSMGYVAVAYGLYKISTPARYTVTLGGTTISINYLKKWGYIKPVPTRDELKEMYIERKENLIESMKEKRDEIKLQADKLRDRKDDIIEGLEKKFSFSKDPKEITKGLEEKIKQQKLKNDDSLGHFDSSLKNVKNTKE